MAIYYNNLVHLLKGRLAGVNFKSTLTISRINLFLNRRQAGHLAKAVQGTPASGGRERLLEHEFGEYSDEFLKAALGIDQLDSIDFSDYEGASILHDLNLPVPETLHNRFDAIIEAGTLEHLFDVPTALRNIIQMLRVGGSLFLFPPSNNMCGHGFYQFSPDFFFRVFSEENGFALDEVCIYAGQGLDIHGLGTSPKVYRVKDPMQAGGHPLSLPSGPVCLLVRAKKIRDCEHLFAPPPQQSAYTHAWSEATEGQNPNAGKSKVFLAARRVWKALPMFVRLRFIRLRAHWDGCLRNRRAFTPVDYRRISPD